MAVLEGDKQEYTKKLKDNVLASEFCKEHTTTKTAAAVR
jgi:hypothetical protein